MQGFNMGRYVPPDVEGTVSGNTLNRKRAPGTLRKDGTQTVRFEMPFAVWCHNCTPHEIIGQGVRFNAIKTKVGYYLSTPIYKFSLKHAVCGKTIEIQTDPKNTAYLVVSGGKARDYGPDHVDFPGVGADGGVSGSTNPILTPAERERRREDAFAALEGKKHDQEISRDQSQRIRELHRARDRDWDDPFQANKRLRTTFRTERKVRERDQREVDELKDRLGTDMEILPASEMDAKRAKLVMFERHSEKQIDKPFLKAARVEKHIKMDAKTRSQSAKDSQKENLRRRLIGNTRAAMNPFGSAYQKKS